MVKSLQAKERWYKDLQDLYHQENIILLQREKKSNTMFYVLTKLSSVSFKGKKVNHF